MRTIACVLRHYAPAEAVEARAVNNLEISARRPVEGGGVNFASDKFSDFMALGPHQYDSFPDKARRQVPRDVPVSADANKVGAALRISRLDG